MLYDMKPILVQSKELDVFDVSLSEEEILNITKLLSDVKFNLPVEAKITIQNKAGLMTVNVKGSFSYETHCSRCNEPVSSKLDIDVTKVISDEEYDEEEENTDYVYMDEYKQIDITSIILEQVVFDMPFRVYCKEDCKGLCPECGINLNYETCDCKSKKGDPRLAILKTLLDE